MEPHSVVQRFTLGTVVVVPGPTSVGLGWFSRRDLLNGEFT